MVKNYIKIEALTKKQEGRFWSNVNKADDSSLCWNWVGYIEPKNGYAKFSLKKNALVASRVSYFLSFGDDPKEQLVLHKCDNPKCVNPNHLFLGSELDNSNDKIQKGRDRKAVGVDAGPSKLTEKDVLEIRDQYRNGITSKQIGDKYGVCNNSVMAIVKRKTWKFLFNGSQEDNEKDILNRQALKYNLGAKDYMSSLTEEKVKEIRAIKGMKQTEIAKKYGVSYHTIYFIMKRRTWKHI